MRSEALEPEVDDWTPGRGLIKGTIWTVATSVVLGAVLCTITYYVGPLTLRGLLNIAWAFAITWVLFVVMHRTAGMTSLPGTLIVVLLALLLFGARYLFWWMYVLELEGVRVSVFYLFHPSVVFEPRVTIFIHLPACAGIVLATAMCKDGDSILSEIADRLMRNPLTGGRV